MSCHIGQNMEQTVLGRTNGSFATLDTAFDQSPHMSDFQNRLMNHNPLLSQHFADNQNVAICSSPHSGMLISPQSEEKINHNVDVMVGALYNRNADFMNQNASPSIKMGGVNIPLNRTQRYTSQQHGSELLENFNLEQDARNVWENTNQTSQNITGMSFLKFVLLLFLIALFIYGIYWLFNQGRKNKNIMSESIITDPGTTIKIEKI